MTSPTSLDREAWPGRLASNRERVAQAARSIEPLLNRVVFTGRQVAQLLETSALPTGARASFAADTVVRVLSTATLDRVATEVQRMGLTRGPRTAKGDRWIVNDDVILEFTYIAGDEDDPAAIWLEYASLLTMAVDVGTRDKTLVARITGAPALLALDWATVRARNESPLDSGELEDIHWHPVSREFPAQISDVTRYMLDHALAVWGGKTAAPSPMLASLLVQRPLRIQATTLSG